MMDFKLQPQSPNMMGALKTSQIQKSVKSSSTSRAMAWRASLAFYGQSSKPDSVKNAISLIAEIKKVITRRIKSLRGKTKNLFSTQLQEKVKLTFLNTVQRKCAV
jgi:hypothetical protein